MPAPTQASHCPRHPGALPGWGKHIQLGGEADHPDETQPGQTPGSGSRGVRQDPVSGGVSCHGALHSREMSRALSRVGTGLARQQGACGGFSCLAPPSQDTSPSSAPSCLPCPCLPFTPPPACPPPCTPAPMPVPAPLPAAPASTPSSQTHSCQPVVVGGGSQRMPSLPGQRRSNWHLSDSCSPF